MSTDVPDRETTVEQVVERLATRFSTLPTDTVRQAVANAYDTMDDVHVRDFVPVLIEKRAKKALKAIAAEQGPAPVE
jgi:hypothetical protein